MSNLLLLHSYAGTAVEYLWWYRLHNLAPHSWGAINCSTPTNITHQGLAIVGCWGRLLLWRSSALQLLPC